MTFRIQSFALLALFALFLSACGDDESNIVAVRTDGAVDGAVGSDGAMEDAGEGRDGSTDGAVVPDTARPFTGRSFDDEATGACPTEARCVGNAGVEDVTVGGEVTRAVHVHDASDAEQVRVIFSADAAPARRYDFDLLFHSSTEPTIIAVHGSGASETTGTWRFLLTPKADTNDIDIAVYSGNWMALGSVPEVRNPEAWAHVSIEASTSWASLTVGDLRFTTTAKAASASAVTSIEVASSGTKPTGTDVYLDNLELEETGWVLATEKDGFEPRFPDITRLKDGRLLAVYQSSPAHTGTSTNRSSIKMTFSSDNGRTWSAPAVAVDSAQDDRDPKVVTLSDGTVLLNWFEDDWSSATDYENLGLFVARLAPGSDAFTDTQHITTAVERAFSHAPIVELDNGDLLLPYYGNGDARVIRSFDGGKTWDTDSDLLIPQRANEFYYEPNIIKLPSGELIMVIRTTSSVTKKTIASTITRSRDGGNTWSPLEAIEFKTESHHMLLTSENKVLLTYGNPDLSLRPTYATMIDEPAAAWTLGAFPPHLLYTSGIRDQANPSSVELAPGRYLTLAYSVGTAQLLAFETTDAFYQ